VDLAHLSVFLSVRLMLLTVAEDCCRVELDFVDLAKFYSKVLLVISIKSRG
jgi:hypothetical protein